MNKREAKFGLLFRHWLKHNADRFPHSCAFELKQTTSNSISFSAVEEHQIDFLKASNSNAGMLYKAPDDSRGIKPFDYFFMKYAAAFVVLKFPHHFDIISVHSYELERRRSKRKSLTASRSKEISTITVNLRK